MIDLLCYPPFALALASVAISLVSVVASVRDALKDTPK